MQENASLIDHVDSLTATIDKTEACKCRLFGGNMTEENKEWARKWKNGELTRYFVDRTSPLVPEIRWDDEIIVETKLSPIEGDIIAISPRPNYCEISIYCDDIQADIDLGEIDLLGVIKEYCRDLDPFDGTIDDILYKKIGRFAKPELLSTAG